MQEIYNLPTYQLQENKMRENMIASNPDSASEAPDKIAQEVIYSLEFVADWAQRTNKRIAEQLEGICMPDIPVIIEDKIDKKQLKKEYPPYFNELRNRLQCIELSLLRINNTLDRCEI